MDNIKIRLLGYYSFPNQKMNPESERVEEANKLAPLFESSILSLYKNPETDEELKKAIESPTVFVFKDEEGNLCAYFTKDKTVRITGVEYNRRVIKQVSLKYKAWFYPGQRINLIQQNSDEIDHVSTETRRKPTISVKKEKTTNNNTRTTRYVEDDDVVKVKTRLRLENNYFIGQFSPERTEGWYKISDIRNSDFTKIEDKERGVKDLTITFRSQGKEFNRFAYYKFTWVLLGTSPLKFGIDLREEVTPIWPKDIVQCLYDSIVHYPASAAKKITRTLDTLNKQLTQSGKEVFIYELLQNANDYPRKQKEGSSLVSVPVDVEFHITDEYLTFQHTGDYFNPKNIAAICDINDGEKSDNVEAIGYKGIGFKTVFLDNDYVYLSTGNYSFRFDKSATDIINTPWQILPVWTEPNRADQTVRHIFSHHANDVFRVKFALKPRDSRILTNRERKDNYIDLFSSVFETERVILFIPNIRKVSVFIGDTATPTIVREKNSSDWCVSKAMTDDVPDFVRERINDVLLNQDADKSDGYEKIPEKYLNFYKTAVKFACKRDGRKLLPVDDAILYCYLPAKRSDWGFKFLMNTDMVPNGARDDIEDIELNHEIAKIAGRQFFYWLKSLIESKNYELDSIFSLIPDFDECKKHKQYANFIEEFQNEFESLIKEKPFVPVVEKDGQESYACIDKIIDDRTGITENNVISDTDFISLIGLDDYCLPEQELRSSKFFMDFLYKYCPSEMDIDFDDIKKICSNEEFQNWLKNTANNTKFITHLIEKDAIESFSSEAIFIEYENDLYKAKDLYYDFDTNGSSIIFLKQYVPNLCEYTRSHFEGNEEWDSFVDKYFMKFDAQAIVDEYITKNDKAIELLKEPGNSVNFYQFVAVNKVDMTDAKYILPFISEDGEAIIYTDGSYAFFYSDKAYKFAKQPWLGNNLIYILSHIYFEGNETEAIKELFESIGFTIFETQTLLSLLKDDADFKKEVNCVIDEEFDTNIAFVKYLFNIRESIKEQNLLFKDYLLCCQQIDGEEVYLCNDDLRYFNQSSYNDNSTFEDNKLHEWLQPSWMYCLSQKYYKEFVPEDVKSLETFLRQQFGVETFTDKSYFEKVILKNKRDIYSTLTTKEKILPFIEYLRRDKEHIFDGSLGNNQIKDMPLLCSDDIIRTHDDSNIKFYKYEEEVSNLYSKDWCPSRFSVLAQVYSEYFDENFFKLFYIDKYDLNEVLKTIIPSMVNVLRNDKEENIDFWRWIKNIQKNIEDINQLNGLVLLDSEDSYFNCSSLYISDSYQNDGIESLVKKYDKQASFVSALYLEEDSEKEKNEWLKLFKKLGLKFDNRDILLNSVLKNLSTFEEDSVVAMMSKHLKDLKEVWSERLNEIVQLRIRTKSGAYKTLNEAIIVDIPEESVVEPFKYISLSNEVASDILASNKELLRLIAKDCSNHQSISSKQEWAEEKIKEYIKTIQTDDERRKALHVDFVRELAKLSIEYNIDAKLYDAILYMVKGEEVTYKLASEITLGTAYSPICNFESNGVTELPYLSEEYIFEGNRDTIKSFFKARGMHHTMTERDIQYLSIRAFSLYFWSNCFSKNLAEYKDWIARGLFNDVVCVPTENGVKKPEELYYTRMWVYASKCQGWKERVPYKSVIDSINSLEAREIFDQLPFNPTLSFKECIAYLLNATDKSEEETSRRREICNWILEAEDIDEELIESYRRNPNALWRNGKWQKKHISELYVIHPDAKQYREIFRGNEFVMITNMFPLETTEFERLCSILGVKCLTGEDFVSTPKNKVDETAEMMKELKPRILVLSAIENAEKYKDKYLKYDEIISKYRFYVCDEIDLNYDTIHNDVERIYENDGRIYYVNSWQHSRTFTRFCNKIKNLLGISVVDNVFEDVFDESRTIEQSIEKYCAAFVHEEDFRYYLENLDCTVPVEIEEEPESEEENYYTEATEQTPDIEGVQNEDGMDINSETESLHPESTTKTEERQTSSDNRLNDTNNSKINNYQQDSESTTPAEESQQTEIRYATNEEEDVQGHSFESEDSSDMVATGGDSNEGTIEAGKSTTETETASNINQETSVSTHEYNKERIRSDEQPSSAKSRIDDPLSTKEKEQEARKPIIQDEYVQVDNDKEAFVPDPDKGGIMGDVSNDTDYEPVGARPNKPLRRKIAKQYSKEEIERLRSNGTPLELESLPPTKEEIDILSQCGISAEQIADTNYLAQLRLYNNLVDNGDTPEETIEEFVKNAADVTTHKLRDGRYIHTCSAARGVMYISPSVWDKMIDDKWKVCVYLDGRGKNFHYINNAEEFLNLVVKDDVVIKITGQEKIAVVKQLYSGLLKNVKGTAYTLIRVASRTNMDAVFAHYVGAMAEAEDGNDTNEY